MSMDALALLKLPHADVAARFAEPTRDARVVKLDDAVIVRTQLPFSTEPDEVSLWLRQTLGPLYDQHDDARGIYVFPDVARPRSTRYDAVIDEVGELGQWAPKVAADHVPKRLAEAPSGSAEAQVRDLMGAIGPDTMEAMQRAMASGDMGAMQALQGQLEQMISQNPGLAEQLEAAMQSMGGAGAPGGVDPLQMQGANPFGLPSEDEAPELWAQARAQAEAMLRDNPELMAQLQAQFGAMLEGEGDEGDDEPEGAPPAKKK